MFQDCIKFYIEPMPDIRMPSSTTLIRKFDDYLNKKSVIAFIFGWPEYSEMTKLIGFFLF